jgi:16S rRNA processing protein RimM
VPPLLVYIEREAFDVSSVRKTNKFAILKLSKIDHINQTDPFLKKELFVEEDIYVSLFNKSRTFITEEFLGFEVITEDQKILGTVVDIIYTGANDVLELDKGALIPVIEDYILNVKKEARTIIVVEPELI